VGGWVGGWVASGNGWSFDESETYIHSHPHGNKQESMLTPYATQSPFWRSHLVSPTKIRQVKGEIAVTKRAAYAAEEAVQRLEKEKQQQDFLIDGLQSTLRSLQQQMAQHAEQLDAQRRETRAARETLAEVGVTGDRDIPFTPQPTFFVPPCSPHSSQPLPPKTHPHKKKPPTAPTLPPKKPTTPNQPPQTTHAQPPG